jgi:2-polyprenyl-3-methyl-5-hydroxy-6-metoxy-1,4-benzoquinol methylase
VKPLQQVNRHFNREAERFDAIYETEKPFYEQWVDGLFRSVVIERFRLICNLAPTAGTWTVLDAGCGSGRYSLALAQLGAARVLGIDVAERMIDLANRQAAQSGLQQVCEFVEASFLDAPVAEQFDVVVATGYFDYIDDPVPHLEKMISSCRGRVFATFPKRWEIRVPTRKLRFALTGGYVRFYSLPEIRELWQAAGGEPGRLSLIDLGRDVVAVYRCL